MTSEHELLLHCFCDLFKALFMQFKVVDETNLQLVATMLHLKLLKMMVTQGGF